LTINCTVSSAPSAGCVPQPVKKKFQPVSGFSAMFTEVGQSTTLSCALMPIDFICSAITRAEL